MENATDALIMAGSVLIFLIALSVCVSSFATLRTGIDQIIDQTETVDMAQNGTKYVNYINESNAIRIVGADTVVSSMYRAKKENYVIYIVLKNLSSIGTEVYNKLNTEGIMVEITDIKYNNNEENPTISGSNNVIKLEGNKNFDKILNDYGLYNEIKNKKFKEYLGVYQDNTEATEENRITYRIITYVEN